MALPPPSPTLPRPPPSLTKSGYTPVAWKFIIIENRKKSICKHDLSRKQLSKGFVDFCLNSNVKL
ncbi:hypothetical protein ACMD2_20384 [Ananas comosus]|uniref:Uncharacterized protein n=1 Tax=Ananas comosus TaxID=4615 RepID=A0A199VUV0_ANACO|nr:hypothetical protein ACMD2_20384 [Ananas comosus]